MSRSRSACIVVLILAGAAGAVGGLVSSTAPPPPDYTQAPTRDLKLLEAIEDVESGGNTHAFNADEDAAGVLQITPIMIDDVNRILGYVGFTIADRWDPRRSREIFWIYTDYYTPDGDREKTARRWKGGPDGDLEQSSAIYWQRVQMRLLK